MSDALGITQFSIVPVEAWADTRLTLECMRVLGALLSFRTRNTDTVWPSREALSARCGGMHVVNVSKATSKLCELGWLQKVGDGGNSRAARYKITVPELSTVAESATNTIVADSATTPPETIAESATSLVADSARGIEHTTEHTNKSNTPAGAQARDALVERGVSAETADRWLLIRENKKQVTDVAALELIRQEAEQAGISFAKAVECCVENMWAWFKASWYAKLPSSGTSCGGAHDPPKASAVMDWSDTPAGVLKRGSELGLEPYAGESQAAYRGRVKNADWQVVRKVSKQRMAKVKDVTGVGKHG
jgi:hypothetical protein